MKFSIFIVILALCCRKASGNIFEDVFGFFEGKSLAHQREQVQE